MISEVRILSRWEMDKIAENPLRFPWYGQNWGVISIYTDGEYLTPETRKSLEEMQCLHMLSLNFWDITDLDYEAVKLKHKNVILFNEDHAKQIIDVVKEMQQDERKMTCIVHCDAGVSRSGAVGEFINDFCRLDYLHFKDKNANIVPNFFIKSMLRKLSGLCPYSN